MCDVQFLGYSQIHCQITDTCVETCSPQAFFPRPCDKYNLVNDVSGVPAKTAVLGPLFGY